MFWLVHDEMPNKLVQKYVMQTPILVAMAAGNS